MSKEFITLRGVEVHNLKRVDLDLPRGRLIVFCGVSGSGKSSLAFDTLYAEGQRRYIETFSAYTRQFLERLEKPAAERIDGIPPAVAVANKSPSRSSRSTVGTTTETNDYLRLLFAKIGRVFCLKCGREVRRDSPQSVAAELARLAPGLRYMLAFPVVRKAGEAWQDLLDGLREAGFVRLICASQIWNLADQAQTAPPSEADQRPLYVVVDRLAAGSASEERVRDSLETAFAKGEGKCSVFIEPSAAPQATEDAPNAASGLSELGADYELDGKAWRRIGFSTTLSCDDCSLEYPAPEPRLVQLQQPFGRLPGVRRVRQRYRYRFRPGRARPEQNAARWRDRTLEQSGVRP